jgi:hypothetical protein
MVSLNVAKSICVYLSDCLIVRSSAVFASNWLVGSLADGAQAAAHDGVGSGFNQRLRAKVDRPDASKSADCRDQESAEKAKNKNLDVRSVIGVMHRVIHLSAPRDLSY